jgi:hypothetical protein
MNTKQLTEMLEAQAKTIEALTARVEELEASREGMRGWAKKVQTHLNAQAKAAPRHASTPEWKGGYRPVRTTPRPAAPAAAAADPLDEPVDFVEPEPAEPPSCGGRQIVPEDLPF